VSVLARKKTTRKPVRRRPAAKSGSRLGRMGWLAAAALAVGWVASDGRAVAYVSRLLPGPETRLAAARPQPVRETGLRGSDDAARPRTRAPAERSAPAAAASKPPRLAVSVPTHVAAIAPSPAPRLAPMRLPRESDAAPEVRRPLAVVAPRPQPLPPMATRSAAPEPVARTAAPAGGMRHATRLLMMRDRPDEAGRHIGSVVTGMQVEVMRADGRWRYVRADDGEGWVDGTFLAGESAALAEPVPRTMLAAMPAAPAAPLAGFAPVPPRAISSR
jgi:hypothetical protein